MKKIAICMPIITGILLVFSMPLEATAAANSPITVAQNAATEFSSMSFISQKETWVAFSVLLFGLAMAFVSIVMLKIERIDDGLAMKIVTLLVIVTGVLFLVAAGYSSEQIAPVIGLLGTVAGYLLGRSENGGSK